MPHRRRSSSSRRRRPWPALALAGALAGCGPSAPRPDADTASAASAAVAAAAPSADDLRRRALADSAARLDSAFRRLRDSLNAESRALSALDRRSDGYARRYDAFTLAERRAAALRALRDTLRAAAASPRAEGRARSAPEPRAP
jgi:hypothetical protein